MKNGKRVFSLVLCFTLFCALALPAHAAEPWKALENIAYYGDRSQCAMTEEQARAFVEVMEKEMKNPTSWVAEEGWPVYGYAALFDTGNGIPALFFTKEYSLYEAEVEGETLVYGMNGGENCIWYYENGAAVLFPDGSSNLSLYDSYICSSSGVWSIEWKIYPFANGVISTTPSTTSYYGETCQIDGKEVSGSEQDQWVRKWTNNYNDNHPLASSDIMAAMEHRITGLTPIDQAKSALLSYASAAQTSTRVTLHLNGGTGGSALWTNDSGTIQVPTNPTREGYTFGGWFTDPDLTVAWNFNSAVTGELSLYAKWVPVSSTASTVGQNTQAISFNGGRVEVQAYTLHADNGGDVTYVKLRDMAALLDGSAAQFNVDWKNGAIYVERGKPYTTRNGTELQPIAGTDGSYAWNTSPILFDGITTAIEGIVLEGSEGSHTFLKLRDLANAVGFTVDWRAGEGIIIQTP